MIFKVVITLVCFWSLTEANSTVQTPIVELKQTKCEYTTATRLLHCTSTKGAAECNATLEGSAPLFKLYALSKVHRLSSQSTTQWFHLFPRKLNQEGWWFYKGVNTDKSSPNRLILHSSDKHASDVEGFEVADTTCWTQLVSVIISSENIETISVDKHVKILGDMFENHEVIGYLNVI